MDLEPKEYKPLPESAIQAAKTKGYATLEDVLTDLQKVREKPLTDEERERIDQLLD